MPGARDGVKIRLPRFAPGKYVYFDNATLGWRDQNGKRADMLDLNNYGANVYPFIGWEIYEEEPKKKSFIEVVEKEVENFLSKIKAEEPLFHSQDTQKAKEKVTLYRYWYRDESGAVRNYQDTKEFDFNFFGELVKTTVVEETEI